MIMGIRPKTGELLGSLVRRGSKTVFNNLIDLQDSSQLLRGAKDTIKDSRDSMKKEDDITMANGKETSIIVKPYRKSA